ncbi:hypothetical protein PROFUN_14570 [Planoprotostelium fungivorum]|uniref:Uncharacterized protein n=1 Tax=Planoprotostelium fungivorum TaxID=1890364 RepID=A0A2P6MZD2_9EUKA|nr:hypothetical protein PROFUN_14570 [Planoprotostelium fungivorum]
MAGSFLAAFPLRSSAPSAQFIQYHISLSLPEGMNLLGSESQEQSRGDKRYSTFPRYSTTVAIEHKKSSRYDHDGQEATKFNGIDPKIATAINQLLEEMGHDRLIVINTPTSQSNESNSQIDHSYNSWYPSDVKEWLDDLKLSQYPPLFIDSAYDNLLANVYVHSVIVFIKARSILIRRELEGQTIISTRPSCIITCLERKKWRQSTSHGDRGAYGFMSKKQIVEMSQTF